jgi:hypothetical protein
MRALLFSLFALPALAAEPATLPTPAGPRAVVDDDTTVACWVDGKQVEAAACPLTATGVGIAKPEAGAIKLPTGPLVVRPGTDDDQCAHLQRITTFDRTKTVDLGRAITSIALPSSTYSKAITDATGVTSPIITQLFKVDLEGDGKDEVIFVADSGDLLYDAKGNASTYAYVGVRRIGADGVLKTHLLFKSRETYSAAEITKGDRTPVHYFGKVFGLTDLDGDKKLEIVVEDGFYEGYSHTIYRVDDAGPTALGAIGCGA